MPEPLPTGGPASGPPHHHATRPRVAGKYFEIGGRRFEPRGVTYGTFAPGSHGHPFPERKRVIRDLDAIRAAGFDCIRTYTPPPRWLLDDAHARGIRALVGLPWEQHMAVLDDRRRSDAIVEAVRESAAGIAGHPGVFAVAVGNEIPAPIVRWCGRRTVERFLERLCEAVRNEDPECLVTYANYPTTEYLELPFLDFLAFNVYLESVEDLGAYLARLHSRAGDRPLVMAELGVDSIRNGPERQARMVSRQLHTSLERGCAGAFVFAWTDEWARGGVAVDDWAFGLTDVDRSPKPALAAVSRALREHPAPPEDGWPSVSVVVCAYQAEDTIASCLDGLGAVDYPDFEVVLIDDGSTDRTAALAECAVERIRASGRPDFRFRMVRTGNQGLSRARNRGIEESRGEIVAFLDADAWPDPRWLRQLAYAFSAGDHMGMGGPNIAPPGIGATASCVARAPGGPVHILQTDEIAEHVPGCNMAFRREALDAIRGFDPRFRVAGDDVDLCWRIQDRGWTIGFSPGAMVWHLPRGSVRSYWRQQVGYGVAEALLEAKWPEKYNAIGHVTWGGRIYGPGVVSFPWKRGRIYGGTWGRAPFQHDEEEDGGTLWEASAMPEWYLATLLLAVLALLGRFWAPLGLASGGVAIGVLVPLMRSFAGAREARFDTVGRSTLGMLKRRALCGCLHFVQPLARLKGRFASGLIPWRNRARAGRFMMPRSRNLAFWREDETTPHQILERLEQRLCEQGALVRRDSGWDDWDLELGGGAGGGAQLRSCVEWHGGLEQLHRYAVIPRLNRSVWWVVGTVLALAIWAAVDGASGVALLLAAASAVVAGRAVWECGTASRAMIDGLLQSVTGPTTIELPPELIAPVGRDDPEDRVEVGDDDPTDRHGRARPERSILQVATR